MQGQGGEIPGPNGLAEEAESLRRPIFGAWFDFL